MLGQACARFCATLLCSFLVAAPATANTVFRCEDARGHVTFTQHGCSAGQNQLLQDARNPTPGSGKPVPMAKSAGHERKTASRAAEHHKEPVVVAERHDGCGNRVTGSARRTAIIQQQVRAGMTRADVESALGKPDRISSQDGRTRYHYRDNDGNSRQVSFDENGCVRGK
ncbi:DUF4124 domain-containing protein [Zestomonas carbonaria]|uniref:DUF4124 domain-containing protein n=1 Tax=Zestomonas carbonaria TaxID=2762745 RepID=A0A7U7EP29_9GAMM|nr:DUF4124 domain-containing protein [Pseudomonas carbonaria]CAD5108584.1 hypothetical protein PSEWESI4_02873 [Pseudomonas carbonaria]